MKSPALDRDAAIFNTRDDLLLERHDLRLAGLHCEPQRTGCASLGKHAAAAEPDFERTLVEVPIHRLLNPGHVLGGRLAQKHQRQVQVIPLNQPGRLRPIAAASRCCSWPTRSRAAGSARSHKQLGIEQRQAQHVHRGLPTET